MMSKSKDITGLTVAGSKRSGRLSAPCFGWSLSLPLQSIRDLIGSLVKRYRCRIPFIKGFFLAAHLLLRDHLSTMYSAPTFSRETTCPGSFTEHGCQSP